MNQIVEEFQLGNKMNHIKKKNKIKVNDKRENKREEDTILSTFFE